MKSRAAFERILSGGQSGVDRAALDAARSAGIAHGGWCPRGRWAEDGPLDARYALRETPSRDPAERTVWNVRDSDATLALVRGAPRGGTALAVRSAGELGRPCRVVDLTRRPAPDAVRSWARRHGVRALNVAGPRESGAPGIYDEAHAFLRELFGATACRGAESRHLLAGLCVIALLAAAACGPAETPAPAAPAQTRATSESSLRIRGQRISLEVASEGREKERGLSGRAGLAPDAGMLFLYAEPGVPGFWMKGMHFDLDIVWLRAGRIVDITPRIPHRTADGSLPIYRPRALVDAVLEVPAGTAERFGWQIGDPVSFDLR